MRDHLGVMLTDDQLSMVPAAIPAAPYPVAMQRMFGPHRVTPAGHVEQAMQAAEYWRVRAELQLVSGVSQSTIGVSGAIDAGASINTSGNTTLSGGANARLRASGSSQRAQTVATWTLTVKADAAPVVSGRRISRQIRYSAVTPGGAVVQAGYDRIGGGLTLAAAIRGVMRYGVDLSGTIEYHELDDQFASTGWTIPYSLPVLSSDSVEAARLTVDATSARRIWPWAVESAAEAVTIIVTMSAEPITGTIPVFPGSLPAAIGSQGRVPQMFGGQLGSMVAPYSR